ncbi:MAG: UPF0236 family protein [Thermoanaerobacterales bacterium]|nr:UPF0236 family protein [Thermoanaerobacterales bacterium]
MTAYDGSRRNLKMVNGAAYSTATVWPPPGNQKKILGREQRLSGQSVENGQNRKGGTRGDGSSWVKEGIELFPNTVYHLDRYHLRKNLTECLAFSTTIHQAVVEAIEQKNLQAHNRHPGQGS